VPSPLYSTLLSTAGAYIDSAKAVDILGRQLARCSATPDNFGPEHLKAVKLHISGALALYVPDKVKREQLTAKIEALAQ